MNFLKNKINLFYLLTVSGLFFYSFTQIDLSLTFSRITFLRNIVASFQYIGYFNRPLSTYIYISILVLLYGFYLYLLKISIKKKLDKNTVWKLIIVTGGILLFSYNAFSYDLFNYIFDAKIFTHYHLNPYVHKALDFPGDPLLSFMRWTHRVYPYGPVWLVLTIPLSYMGFGFFLPTFFLFKLLAVVCYLGSVYFIGKIFKKIQPERQTFGIIFFGLNPLVLIECLVSGHLDIVMIFFALWATNYLINKKYAWALLLLLLSIGVKFSTVLLTPIFLVVIFWQLKRKPVIWDRIFIASVALMSLTVVFASLYSGNFQPWYLVLPFSYAVFVCNKYYIFIPYIVTSFFALLTYTPYLYLGNWNPPVPQMLSNIYWGGILISIIFVIFYRVRKRYVASNRQI